MFAMNHSSLLPGDDKVLEERRDTIVLYLASNKMLLGVDLKNIDMVIVTSPYDQPAALLQAAGRMSRRTGRGYRTAGQLYILWNGSDLTSSNTNMSQEVRRICREGSTTCTRQILEGVFQVDVRRWQVGPMAAREEEVTQEELDQKRKMQHEFKLLQDLLTSRIGACKDNAELIRILQGNDSVRQMMTSSPMEEGNSLATTSREAGDTRHCCHKHDLDQ